VLNGVTPRKDQTLPPVKDRKTKPAKEKAPDKKQAVNSR
jgi:hypothetical protein